MNKSLNISSRSVNSSPQSTSWKLKDLSTEWKISPKVWIFLIVFCTVDRYFNSILLRLLTALVFPIWLADYVEVAVFLLSLFNVVICTVFKLFINVTPFFSSMKNDMFGKSPKSNYVPVKLGTPYPSTLDKLLGHFAKKNQVSPTNASAQKPAPISQTQNTFLNWSRNSLHSSDIYTDEQLDWRQDDNPTAFTVKYSKSDISNRFPYQIDDGEDLNIKDSSRVDDLLDISQNLTDLFAAGDKSTSEKSSKGMLTVSGSRRGKHGLDSTSSYKLGDGKSSSFFKKMNISRSSLFSNVVTQPITVSTEELFQEYKMKPQEIAIIEENIRRFIGTHIIKPLLKAVVAANAQLSKGTSSLRVGSSSIVDLQALIAREQNLIPFVAPIFHYFGIVQDQEYLLNKLEKWSKSDIIYDFSPEAQKTGFLDWPDMTNNKTATRLPSESELILKLFAAFMDCQISTVPINRFHEHGKPFTSVYLVSASRLKKEQPIFPYFVELQDDAAPTTFRFHSKYPMPIVTAKTVDAITMISCVIAQTHYHNDGLIYGLDLTNIGLGMDVLTM